MPRRCAISLVSMPRAADLAEYLRHTGGRALFELAYTMSPGLLDEMEPLLAGKVASVHACCPAVEFFPNLASADPVVAAQNFDDMRLTLDTAVRFGASAVVLHPGYATDAAMPKDSARRSRLLAQKEFSADVRFEEGSICGPEYNRSTSYLKFAQRAKEELVRLASIYAERGVTLAAENLNPRVGYLFHTPDEMIALSRLHPNLGLCLDLGHLFICSLVYGFDYIDGISAIAATGKLVTCHLHSNSSAPGRFTDDHHSIDRHGFPIEAALAALRGSGALLVLETIEEPLRNTYLLRELLEKGRA